MPLVEGRWLGWRRDPAPKEPTPKPPAMRVVEVYSGLGLGIGLAAGGMRVIQGFDVGLTRDILLRSGVEVQDFASLSTVADTVRLARADVVAGYLLTERQASDLLYLAGMTRTEWIIAISPARRVSDISPWLWQYGYGVTSLRCRATAYGSGDGGEYDITIARQLDRDQSLLDSLLRRQTKDPVKLPPHLLHASSVERIAARKGLPRGISLQRTESELAVVESACPTMLPYQISQIVIARHDGVDMPLPDRATYDGFIAETLAKSEGKPRDITDRTLANFFSRLRNGRDLLRGRTYHRESDEEEVLEAAVVEFNAWFEKQDPPPPKLKSISPSVMSDYKSALRWDRRLWESQHPSDRKDPPPPAGQKPKRRMAPSWYSFSFSERFIPPPPPREPGKPLNFNRLLSSSSTPEDDIDDVYADDDGYEIRNGKLRRKGTKRGRPPGSRNKAKPKT
ncbi:hypothetical protein [Gellertiella hungarica]|uniref:Uncharacterized protein n=1 Tax=Gellertiella hungarica TaxID=1572859 RepID=A0A7W6J520_9HYPH|nr:hypothetical protein [Gellertiella hungarica]MBB4064026.1 hypothetical protein [Gellertiella hungarica]